MDETQQTIKQVLQQYFDALYHSDVSLLKQVFHPQAKYITASSGELVNLTMPDYFAMVEQRISPASKQQTRTDQIVQIDLISDCTALAKVKCSIPPKHFVDLLSLIKLDGRWQIISKVFHYQIDKES
ncbi:nuclear transport factor 2 family protein [Catenovulum agarivorans]|uniref:nuclear transport factor 2 family protein n=1 Tax=Catenovulum agarivorans TaxID=1172192 RepID=UPI0003186093|nr:nuclear transport factor 2 family protein [Catenovulum agarivorans]